ncbi:hypothetical protein G6W57_01115 [Streptomyces sp. CAI-121]|uniref:hypothetical protein n=1 Tax=unclassified Streptomyces TaxID=2593676 RepID=UPI001587CB5A|nr:MULTISPECIES: hypothetical protein [unclassified Streptomyces]NUV65715.1 hypothetical protein [Streptomyces sp. CAI-121]NUW12452.1 hypothetical protein [Streptomyces sp. CAI-68]
MSLDTILAAGQALAAVHGAVDQVINAALYYGPGILALTATIVAFRVCAWAADRYHQAVQDRADRRAYTARAFRLCRVADNADAVLAHGDNTVNEYLDNKLAATPDLAPEEGR